MADHQPEQRDVILASFQSITAIDDVAEAIFHLDETNWDLLSAISRVIPQDVGSSNNQNAVNNDQDVDIEMIDEDISVITPKVPLAAKNQNNSTNMPSTSVSNNSSRRIHFVVKYLNTVHKFDMAETCTIGDLRIRISEQFDVSPCKQLLNGLTKSSIVPPIHCTLSSLNLPQPCEITLTTPDPEVLSDNVTERLGYTYALNVDCEGKSYRLIFPGTKTVLEVKTDVYTLTDIPVRHQVWSGWPDVPEIDLTVLAMSGITFPEHNLKLKRAATSKPPPKEYRRIIIDNSDSEVSSVEEFEDASESFTADDDIFVDNVQSKRLEPLIPDNIDDETIGCIQFAERFQDRYGPQHPIFFQGSLDNAIKEACMKPAKDRRLLGVYLHHEGSVLSNVFCAQLLGCESVLEILMSNFVVYGWDLTFESNKNMLLSSISNTLGSVASMTVRNIPLEKLPVLIIIMRIRSNTEIFSVINGNVSVTELLGQLVEADERWSSKREEEEQEESERAARQQVKWEQDEAYRQSLEADRAKEEAKKQQEMAESREKQRIESERQEAEAKKEAHRQLVLSRLPKEPSLDSTEPITKIRFRLPHGRSLERRFMANAPLKVLLDYLTVEGFPTEEYKVIASWPRRDLTAMSVDSTLSELKLCPQETVMLEER